MTNIEEQHEIVKKSLVKFVSGHIPHADFSFIDDIVLSYIISILEEASQDPCFDVEGFIEMMSAYFPDFSRIDSGIVCNWIFALESELSKHGKKDTQSTPSISLNSLSLSDIIPEAKLCVRTKTLTENPEDTSRQTHIKRVKHLSENSDGGSTDSSNCDYFSEECDALQEMFPDSSYLEVKHCIAIAKGDIDSATQILIHRQETGQSLSSNACNNVQSSKNVTIDDTELKNRIIARYSYVDKNAASREYKPVVPKVEPKKLVRYRDNKIVSLKGERYTEVRRDDDGELKKPKKPICP